MVLGTSCERLGAYIGHLNFCPSGTRSALTGRIRHGSPTASLPVLAVRRFTFRRVRKKRWSATIAGCTAAEFGEGGTSAVFAPSTLRTASWRFRCLLEKLRQDKPQGRVSYAKRIRRGAVRHPNVVQTLEVGEASQAAFLRDRVG